MLVLHGYRRRFERGRVGSLFPRDPILFWLYPGITQVAEIGGFMGDITNLALTV